MDVWGGSRVKSDQTYAIWGRRWPPKFMDNLRDASVSRNPTWEASGTFCIISMEVLTMGLDEKDLDAMEAIVSQTMGQYEKVFGSGLTKSEFMKLAQKELERKRQDWIESRIAHHSISELMKLVTAIENYRKEKPAKVKKNVRKK